MERLLSVSLLEPDFEMIVSLTIEVVNFIQRPLPDEGPFPSAGAAGTYGQPGALGMGQRASTGLVQFNQFFSYVMPLIGKLIGSSSNIIC